MAITNKFLIANKKTLESPYLHGALVMIPIWILSLIFVSSDWWGYAFLEGGLAGAIGWAGCVYVFKMYKNYVNTYNNI